jgi:hypothetical protein
MTSAEFVFTNVYDETVVSSLPDEDKELIKERVANMSNFLTTFHVKQMNTYLQIGNVNYKITLMMS